MRAIFCTKYGSPEVLQLKEVPKPISNHNEICIKIYATAVTGSDIIGRSFKINKKYRLLLRLVVGFTKPRNPILGTVLAGEIESVGKDIKRFNKSDQVFGMTPKSVFHPRIGTYVEYRCLPEDSMIAIKPSNVTYDEAAAIPYGAFVALHFLRKGCVQRGQNVLIYGASGAVGTSAIQLAKYFGTIVTGVCSTTNLKLVNSLGADTVIDYTKEDFTNRGDLYDLILDAVPYGKINRKRLRLQCKKLLVPNGKHISIEDGAQSFHIEDLILLKELVEAGKIKPVIDRIYPLEQIVEAHRYVDTGHKKGNVVIKVC